MKPTDNPIGSTLLALAALAVAACASPPGAEELDDDDAAAQSLKRRIPDLRFDREPTRVPDRSPDRSPDEIQELTAGECFHFGGTIAHDSSCPQTTSEAGSGGKLVGTYSCTIGGKTLCIDESVQR